jgi:hypothetical protein
VEAVRQGSPRHAKSLAFGRLVRIGADELVIAFPKDTDFHRTTVSGEMGRQLIDEALAVTFGAGTRLVIDQDAADTAPPSIAEEEAKERAAHERGVEFKVRRHPATEAVLRIFGGEVEHIQLLERSERASVAEPDGPDDNA